MGLNTAMIIRNDFLQEIADERFGQTLYDAVCNAGMASPPYHGQAFDVLPSQHADYVQVVVICGNTIRRLGTYAGTYRSSDEEVLRHLADGMGFRLVRKAKR